MLATRLHLLKNCHVAAVVEFVVGYARCLTGHNGVRAPSRVQLGRGADIDTAGDLHLFATPAWCLEA
jgi:hypothetical protein